MSLEPGGAIGQYRIVEQLGRGGMAAVYKGYHPRLDRFVAIKVLPAYFAEEPGFAERFAQEAVMIARFDHPNILTVHDYGEEHGVSYLVMAYVEGGTLAERVGEPMPGHEVAGVIRPIASALDYAHERGILHRDIKPANILLRKDGTPVLADFGIAKMTDQTHGLTRTGAVVGTPEYMAPEQAMGEPAGEAADQYSLGVVAYELLTGRVPYRAETPVAVLLAHAHKELPRPRTLNGSISQAVESAVTRALAKRPQDRYPNAMAFADALVAAAAPLAAAASGESAQRATLDAVKESAQPVVRQMRGYWDRFVAPSLTNIVQAPAAPPKADAPAPARQASPSAASAVPPSPIATPVAASLGPAVGDVAPRMPPTVLESTGASGGATVGPSPTDEADGRTDGRPATSSSADGGPPVEAAGDDGSYPEPELPPNVAPPTEPDLVPAPPRAGAPLGEAHAEETSVVSTSEMHGARAMSHAELPSAPEASAPSTPVGESVKERLARLEAATATHAHVKEPEPVALSSTPMPVAAGNVPSSTALVHAHAGIDGYLETLTVKLPPAPAPLIDAYVRYAPMVAIVVGGLGVLILVVFRLLSSVGASVISLFGGVAGAPPTNEGFVLIALGLIVGGLTIYGGRQMQQLRSIGWWALAAALVLGVVERTAAHVWAGALLTLVIAYAHLLAKHRYR